MAIGINDVRQAYKKLLASVYYDKSNTNLVLRKKIAKLHDKAEREKSFEQVLKLVKGEIPIESVENEIGYVILPKGVRSKSTEEEMISNDRIKDKNIVERFNLMIDAPIEVYIISVLWLMKIGYRLDRQLSDQCYGNRLLLNQDEEDIVSGRGLFKHYVKQYQRWRDDGFKAAQKQLENGSDVGYVNLDITSFYYHVRFHWDDIDLQVSRGHIKKLNQLLKGVHQKYTTIVRRQFLKEDVFKLEEGFEDGAVILPIGLSSSYTLANYYLKDLDKVVEETVKPIFYGRYVDDIVLVLAKPNFSDEIKSDDILDSIKVQAQIPEEKYDLSSLPASTRFICSNMPQLLTAYIDLEENEAYQEIQTSDLNLHLNIEGREMLYIQNEKVLIYEFKADQSLAAIEKLKHDLQEHTSEFRFLPDVDGLDFDVNAYELQYDDSKGKPRTLKDYKEDKYGLASFLYKRTAVSLWLDKTDVKDEAEEILRFFKGRNIIDYFQQWERLFTYLVVAERKSEIVEFLENSLNEIEKCSYKTEDNENFITIGLRGTLSKYLFLAFSQALTLKPQLYKDGEWLRNRIDSLVEKQELTVLTNILADNYPHPFAIYSPNDIEDTVINLRNSYLVRHYFTTHPLIEFTNYGKGKEFSELQSLIRPGLKLGSLKSDDFEIEETEFFPGYIKFYKVCIYLLFRQILQAKENEEFETNDFRAPIFLEKAFELFAEYNSIPEDVKESAKKDYFEFRCRDQSLGVIDNKKMITEIKVNEVEEAPENIKVGLANMEVKWSSHSINSLKGRPVMNGSRLSRLTNLLNKFEQGSPQGDLCILPEVSVPHDLFYWASTFAMQHKKGLVFGLEHFNTGEKAYNFIISCLPLGLKGQKDAIVLPRLKNHYSPQEKHIIKNYHLKCVSPEIEHYHLFHWKGYYFTTFYCFELADIQHRSWFRSKIDFLAAPEFNRDVNYFSNIVESTARDLNTYVLQVNTSNFGDSRISRPTKTAFKDLVKVKGGDNDVVIIGTMNIKEFRNFQEMGYGLQKDDDNIYKPSPPNFEVNYVKKRIEGKWIFEEKNTCDEFSD
jgi:hypothetical protein